MKYGVITVIIWINTKGRGILIMTLEEMRQAKQAKGYSFKQLAEYTGVPLGTLQKIFDGETKTPRYETRRAIEKVLDPKNDPAMIREEAAAYEVKEKIQGDYTLEDYYALPEDLRVELINGVIYKMDAPSPLHQVIAGEIYYQISTFIRAHNGPCLVMQAPVDVQLDRDNRTMVEPDVLILCDRRQIEKWGIAGAPDFVLEVLSPGTRHKDYMIKLQKYQAAGVKEYWMINPEKERAMVYDFTQNDWPEVYPLSGEAPVGIYDGKLKIDLEPVGALIREWSA